MRPTSETAVDLVGGRAASTWRLFVAMRGQTVDRGARDRLADRAGFGRASAQLPAGDLRALPHARRGRPAPEPPARGNCAEAGPTIGIFTSIESVLPLIHPCTGFKPYITTFPV